MENEKINEKKEKQKTIQKREISLKTEKIIKKRKPVNKMKNHFSNWFTFIQKGESVKKVKNTKKEEIIFAWAAARAVPPGDAGGSRPSGGRRKNLIRLRGFPNFFTCGLRSTPTFFTEKSGFRPL